MKLSANFELSELTKSQVAERKGLPNNPSANQIDNLKALCINVLQPIRSEFDKPVIISSGYQIRRSLYRYRF
jgi:zinc D-Ala-D-Ala carboxypeptidase